MNKLITDYRAAEAAAAEARRTYNAAEQHYILEHGIKNPDGTVPRYIWAVDLPEEEWDALNEAACADPVVKAAADMDMGARQALIIAEDKLIDWSLSILPKRLREELEPGRNILRIRERLIELALSCDINDAKKHPRQSHAAVDEI